MKATKKLFALLLAVVLVCTTLPLALAEDGDATIYGTAGNLVWTLDNKGVLTINGEGEMPDEYYLSSLPSWKAYASRITSVVISDGITSIGHGAFSNCSFMSSITIPETVTSIGFNAFYMCTSLTSITIPERVTSISSYAFYNCFSLKAVTIPNGITRIEECTFSNCNRLESVSIPESVTSIGVNAFYGCKGLTRVDITDIEDWCSISFGDSAANPLASAHNLYLNGILVSNLTIPDTITAIKNYTFQGCNSLTSVTIPESVKSIGISAFYGCSNLTSIDLPISVSSVENGAFNGCSILETIKINNGACIIYNSPDTISSNATIYGFEGSPAQSYAEQYDRIFVSLGEYTHEHTPVIHENLGNCQSKGFRITTCSVCGEQLNYETLGYGEHQYSIHRDNCEEEGIVYFNCIVCGEEKTEVMPATEHTFDEPEQDDNCGGLVEYYTCTCCGYRYENVIIEPNHNYVEISRKEADCDDSGYIEYNCSNCGARKIETIPAKGHSFGDWTVVIEPCVQEGSKERTCSVCGKIETEKVPATGEHNWSEWMTQLPEEFDNEFFSSLDFLAAFYPEYKKLKDNLTGLREATCTRNGKRARFCSSCFESESEIIPALEHNPSDWVLDGEATCTHSGWRSQRCQTCGNIVNYEEIPATGHTFTDWNKFVMATDATVGVEIRFCKVCGYYELRKADPANPTDPTNPTNPTDPTEPTNPTDPTEPTNPTDPTDPTNPTDSTEPTTEPTTQPSGENEQNEEPQGFFQRIAAFFRNLFDRIFGIFRR